MLPFSKLNKTFFFDTLIQKLFMKLKKITNFRGELTGILVKKEALMGERA